MTLCIACGAEAEAARCPGCGEDLTRVPTTFAEEVGARRFTEAEVTSLLADLLAQLGLSHTRGVVHGDLRPEALTRRAGDWVLLVVRPPGPRVRSAWTAPEGPGAPSADIYGAGLIAVWMLSRRRPEELADRTGALRWEPVVQARPELVALLRLMLEADPARRAKDAVVLSERLRLIGMGASSTYVPARETRDTVDDPSTLLPSQLEALDLDETIRKPR